MFQWIGYHSLKNYFRKMVLVSIILKFLMGILFGEVERFLERRFGVRSLLEVTPSLFDFSGFSPHGALLIGKESSRLIWWDEKSCKNKNELIVDYCLGPRREHEREE